MLAGVGNVLKSEGCFAARVDPWRRLGELGADELERVVASTRVADGRIGARGPPSAADLPARRPALPALRDADPLAPQGDDARTTYWCPRCQG